MHKNNKHNKYNEKYDKYRRINLVQENVLYINIFNNNKLLPLYYVYIIIINEYSIKLIFYYISKRCIELQITNESVDTIRCNNNDNVKRHDD